MVWVGLLESGFNFGSGEGYSVIGCGIFEGAGDWLSVSALREGTEVKAGT